MLKNNFLEAQETSAPDPVFMVVQHCIPIFTQLIGKPYLEQEDDKLLEEVFFDFMQILTIFSVV